MKQKKLQILAWIGIVMAMFAIESCEMQNAPDLDFNQQGIYVKGDGKDSIPYAVHDTVFIPSDSTVINFIDSTVINFIDSTVITYIDSVIYDTLPSGEVDTIYIYRKPKINCVKFFEGQIFLHDSTGLVYAMSFPYSMNIADTLRFKTEADTISMLTGNTFIFKDLGTSKVDVRFSNETDIITSSVDVPWVMGLTINGDYVETCVDYTLNVSILERKTENGYLYLKVNYAITFEDDYGITRSAISKNQVIVAPIKEEEKPEPENVRTKDIDYVIDTAQTHQGGRLTAIINIVNSLETIEDSTISVEAPIVLSIKAGDSTSVIGSNFDVTPGVLRLEESKCEAKSTTKDGVTISWNEYTVMCPQDIVAGGEHLNVVQTVTYTNDYVITFEDTTVAIPLTLDVQQISKSDDGDVKAEGGYAKQDVKLTYEASLTDMQTMVELTDKAEQKISILFKAISFDGQVVDTVYQTATYPDINEIPIICTAVLTHSETNPSQHYVHYRFEGSANTSWTSVTLTDAEYDYIINHKGAPMAGQWALTVCYPNGKTGDVVVGYLDDHCPIEVMYYSPGYNDYTVMTSQNTMFGALNRAVVCSGSRLSNGLIELKNPTDVKLGEKVIYPAQTSAIYFL
ncbi:MAG: hypothetical protein E7004_01780 [Alphaproteobacteria bacterium]|nr:hypothetical protein [Alphaproteobacteria bacterium]